NPPPKPRESEPGRSGSPLSGSVFARERFFRQARAFAERLQLRVCDLPAARAQAAVGADVDPLRVAEDLDRVEDPVAHELRRLDEVRVDVKPAEPEDRVVRQVAEL